MLKRLSVILLSMHFLLGSCLLPKGDFALLADLPAMYQQYTNIDNPEDIGVTDFVIDYLLNGEGIFGADMYKGHPVPYASVQFQHAANPLCCVFFYAPVLAIKPQVILNKHYVQNDRLVNPNHSSDLFRPPIA